MTRRLAVTAICALTLLALIAGAMPASCGDDNKALSVYFDVYISGGLDQNACDVYLWRDSGLTQLGYDYYCSVGTSGPENPQNATYWITVSGYSKVDQVIINSSSNGKHIRLDRP